MIGELSGVIRPFSAAALAKRQALSYCLTILSNLESILRPWGTLYNLLLDYKRETINLPKFIRSKQ